MGISFIKKCYWIDRHKKKALQIVMNTNRYECNVCQYHCKNASALIKHIVIHSEKKKFHCKQCSYKCKLKAHLKSHNVKHNKRALKISCSECDFKTNRRNSLQVHFRCLDSSLSCVGQCCLNERTLFGGRQCTEKASGANEHDVDDPS